MTGPTADQPRLRREPERKQVEPAAPAAPTEPAGGGPTGAAEDEYADTRTPDDGYRAL